MRNKCVTSKLSTEDYEKYFGESKKVEQREDYERQMSTNNGWQLVPKSGANNSMQCPAYWATNPSKGNKYGESQVRWDSHSCTCLRSKCEKYSTVKTKEGIVVGACLFNARNKTEAKEQIVRQIDNSIDAVRTDFDPSFAGLDGMKAREERKQAGLQKSYWTRNYGTGKTTPKMTGDKTKEIHPEPVYINKKEVN